MKFALIIPYLLLDILLLVASAVMFFLPYFAGIEDGVLPLVKRLENK